MMSSRASQIADLTCDEAKRTLEAILENVPVGIAVTGGPPNFPIEFVSRYVVELTGAPAKELLGIPAGQHQSAWGLLLADGERPPKREEMALYRACCQGEAVRDLEEVLQTRQGENIPILISASPIRDAQGKIVAAISTWLDISERKKAEQALKASEQRFVNYFKSTPTPSVISTIADGAIVDVNASYERLFGFSREELVGRKTTDLNIWVDPQARQQLIHELREKGRITDREMSFRTSEGKLIDVVFSVEAVRFDEQELIMSTLTDITERKRIEEEKRRHTEELESANRELEQFAYVASHDLREPLRMIASFSQLLQKRYQDKLGADANEFIGFIVDGAARMQNLIDDLLIYSRVATRGKPFEPVDMEKVLQDVLMNLKMAVEESGAEITHDRLPVISADPTQMNQLLQNLISNAIKFRREETPRVHVSAKKDRSQVIFSVSDNGIGIDPELFGRLFLLFQRLEPAERYPGSGIGLAVAKKIVQRHGGRIWLESRPGKGSTFFFTVPVGSGRGGHAEQ